jgi:Xaa-Pro aminopeptidase
VSRVQRHRPDGAAGGRHRRVAAGILGGALLGLLAGPLGAQSPLPPLRQQADIRLQWLQYRLDSVLPGLMRRHGVQMWVVCGREYNEDPAFFSLVAPTSMSMGRRTILVFHDRGPGQPLERLNLGYGGAFYTSVRDTALARAAGSWGRDRFTLLRRVIDQRRPASIAIDMSEDDAFADGLSASDYGQLRAALGTRWMARVRPAEGLVLDYLAVRAPGMLEWERRLMEIAHQIIATAFSREVVTPGVTRADDIAWWARQRLNDLGLDTWFQPYVTVQRRGVNGDTLQNPIILPGDVLHIDFGISAMGLRTDTQHMAYVLQAGETAPPPGLLAAMRNTNRLQDIVMTELKPGRSGNEVLAASLARMRAAGIRGAVYSHPVGDHGHAAGAFIGLFDRQEPSRGRGEVRVLPDTWYAIELVATTPVAEWDDQPVAVYEEEDAALDRSGAIHWILRRQTDFHLVR